MAIPSEIRRLFSADVRGRGAAYHARGRVRLNDVSADRVSASVNGSRLYRVRIDFSDDVFDGSCTCPFAEKWGGVCKHVWATLLTADDQGALPHAPALDDQQDEDAQRGSRSTRVRKADYDDEDVRRPLPLRPKPQTPAWKKALRHIRDLEQRAASRYRAEPQPFPSDRRIVYLLDVPGTLERGEGLIVEVATQKQTRDGSGWERPKSSSLEYGQWINAPDESDRLIARMLVGTNHEYGYYSPPTSRRFVLPGSAYDTTLRMMCNTGRCGLRPVTKQETFTPLRWEEGEPWNLLLEIAPRQGGGNVVLSGALRRGERRIELHEPRLLLADGLLLFEDAVARFRHFGAWAIAQTLRQGAPIEARPGQAAALVRELAAMPRLPALDLHPSLEIHESRPPLRPRLTLRRARNDWEETVTGTVGFEYDGHFVDRDTDADSIFVPESRQIIRRDRDAESRAAQRLQTLGIRLEYDWGMSRQALRLKPARVHDVVMTLIAEGWNVQAEGAIYRRPGQMRLSVTSGIDWFEMQGGVEFDGGELVSLPKLLAALQQGQQTVTLDDGSIGLLPTEWLAKYATLAGVGDATDDALRFSRTQVGFLDALLASMPEARIDETFQRARNELRAFQQIEPLDPPDSFVGTLRPYQRDGLGWLAFLQRFGFGGCLADDMGLGKTIEVLALLESRRHLQAGPSLVVVPRSLVFNWKAEAQRFTPQLRVLDHTGITRTRASEHFANFDVVVTTYGTLRRDVAYLKDTTFDYAVLDEAQAIKNAATGAAKAARLLRANHRLALSGTPIENRLSELWSLFEFLNPGMLGGASVFRALVGAGGSGASASENGNGEQIEGRQVLARALRPFILRRTKQQVEKDLPEKLEQTIHCDLEPPQRKLYDELREHYRQALLGQIDSTGINRAKIQILEALLRLRQAACHPGLIDKGRTSDASAKLDTLMARLDEVTGESHKALVFSQFTSMLAIVRKRLDDAGVTYEYLDGKTRDRQARVERFQSDENCRLFLISLKAGGVGLNLTAADYVFLLDPWWNPAVEAQAIDRTHRIGQTRRVFAYRLIARDTVEEKVLQLQQTKRDLADAIITADNSLIASLKREDLELLLS
jgi:hypothetical protein